MLLLVAGLFACAIAALMPGSASAQTCTAAGTTVGATYSGAALSNTVTAQLTCSGFTGTTTYYLCVNGSITSGSGGNAISPFRQLDDGSGNKASWQMYTIAGDPVTDPHTSIGSASGTRLNNDNATINLDLRFPVQAVGAGTFSTTLNFNVNLKQQADCSDTQFPQVSYQLNYSVTVPPSCSTLTAGALNFGNITSTAAAINAQAVVTLTCTTNSPYTVFLGGGANNDGTSNRMARGTSYLRYSLFSDSARSTRWTSTQGVSGTGTGSAQAFNVFGRISAQTTPPVGTYTDTVIVTLRY